MEEKFKTVQDVAEWLEERGFPQEVVVEAFVGNTLYIFTQVLCVIRNFAVL